MKDSIQKSLQKTVRKLIQPFKKEEPYQEIEDNVETSFIDDASLDGETYSGNDLCPSFVSCMLTPWSFYKVRKSKKIEKAERRVKNRLEMIESKIKDIDKKIADQALKMQAERSKSRPNAKRMKQIVVRRKMLEHRADMLINCRYHLENAMERKDDAELTKEVFSSLASLNYEKYGKQMKSLVKKADKIATKNTDILDSEHELREIMQEIGIHDFDDTELENEIMEKENNQNEEDQRIDLMPKAPTDSINLPKLPQVNESCKDGPSALVVI